MPKTAPPAVVQTVQDYKSGLAASEQSQMQDMTSKWVGVEKSLEGSILSLTQDIELRKNQGEAISAWRVSELDRYKSLLSQAQSEIAKYTTWANGQITSTQASNAKLGLQSAVDGVNSSFLGSGQIPVAFSILPVAAVETMAGMTSDGSPLLSLLKEAYPDAVGSMTQKLLDGIASGKSPRETAKAMADGLSAGLNRCLTIARTESLRAFREAARSQYLASGVVKGYKRLSAKNDRTCLACLMADGTFYELGTPFEEHVCGRCAMVPVVKGLPEVKWETGAEWLKTQPEEIQQAVIKDKKVFELWKAGGLPPQAFFVRATHPLWGSSLMGLSAKGVLAQAEKLKAAKASKQAQVEKALATKAATKAAQTAAAQEAAKQAELVEKMKTSAGIKELIGLKAAEVASAGMKPGYEALWAELNALKLALTDRLIEELKAKKPGEFTAKDVESILSTLKIQLMDAKSKHGAQSAEAAATAGKVLELEELLKKTKKQEQVAKALATKAATKAKKAAEAEAAKKTQTDDIEAAKKVAAIGTSKSKLTSVLFELDQLEASLEDDPDNPALQSKYKALKSALVAAGHLTDEGWKTTPAVEAPSEAPIEVFAKFKKGDLTGPEALAQLQKFVDAGFSASTVQHYVDQITAEPFFSPAEVVSKFKKGLLTEDEVLAELAKLKSKSGDSLSSKDKYTSLKTELEALGVVEAAPKPPTTSSYTSMTKKELQKLLDDMDAQTQAAAKAHGWDSPEVQALEESTMEVDAAYKAAKQIDYLKSGAATLDQVETDLADLLQHSEEAPTPGGKKKYSQQYEALEAALVAAGYHQPKTPLTTAVEPESPYSTMTKDELKKLLDQNYKEVSQAATQHGWDSPEVKSLQDAAATIEAYHAATLQLEQLKSKGTTLQTLTTVLQMYKDGADPDSDLPPEAKKKNAVKYQALKAALVKAGILPPNAPDEPLSETNVTTAKLLVKDVHDGTTTIDQLKSQLANAEALYQQKLAYSSHPGAAQFYADKMKSLKLALAELQPGQTPAPSLSETAPKQTPISQQTPKEPEPAPPTPKQSAVAHQAAVDSLKAKLAHAVDAHGEESNQATVIQEVFAKYNNPDAETAEMLADPKKIQARIKALQKIATSSSESWAAVKKAYTELEALQDLLAVQAGGQPTSPYSTYKSSTSGEKKKTKPKPAPESEPPPFKKTKKAAGAPPTPFTEGIEAEGGWHLFKSRDEMDGWGQKNFPREFFAKFSSTLRQSLSTYTGSGYSEMNRTLRSGGSPTRTIENLRKLLDQCRIPEDLISYRGVRSRLSLKAGDTFTDLGFMSTSLNAGVSEGFGEGTFFTIRVPKGAKGAYVDLVSSCPGEKELLLQAGTKMRILRVEGNHVYAEVIVGD